MRPRSEAARPDFFQGSLESDRRDGVQRGITIGGHPVGHDLRGGVTPSSAFSLLITTTAQAPSEIWEAFAPP